MEGGRGDFREQYHPLGVLRPSCLYQRWRRGRRRPRRPGLRVAARRLGVLLLQRVPRDTRLPTAVVDGVMRALVGPAAEPRPARTEAAVMALVTGNGALLPRPEQRAVLEDAAARCDTVVGFPTGMGKSLCFLYGGLLRRRGLTLVIGPLVATNADLVAKLNSRACEHEGTHAGPIADSLGGAALADPADALRSALCAGIEVLFCTPESFIRVSAALGWVSGRLRSSPSTRLPRRSRGSFDARTAPSRSSCASGCRMCRAWRCRRRSRPRCWPARCCPTAI